MGWLTMENTSSKRELPWERASKTERLCCCVLVNRQHNPARHAFGLTTMLPPKWRPCRLHSSASSRSSPSSVASRGRVRASEYGAASTARGSPGTAAEVGSVPDQRLIGTCMQRAGHSGGQQAAADTRRESSWGLAHKMNFRSTAWRQRGYLSCIDPERCHRNSERCVRV